MKTRPLVSAVIATYNMAAYLPFAIRSALEQTYDNFEVLIVDDGSTDNTREIVTPFLEDPRVRYHVQENKGQAAAKNLGAREASGDFVAFLDADDLWTPDKLEVQMPLFARSSVLGVVYARLYYIDESGKQLGVSNNKLFRGHVSGPLLIANFIGFGTSIVKKECFDRLGLFREELPMGIDYDLWLRFSTQYEFDYVDRPLLRYRVWAGQMSNNCKGRYVNGMEIMQKFLRDYPGLVDQRTVNEAWAHTYVGFGRCLKQTDGRLGATLKYHLHALRLKPGYWPAWRAIAGSLLRLE